jgi:integrase
MEGTMGRRLRDKNLETREARKKLKRSDKPYWRLITTGLHLGYRKGRDGYAVWVLRKYLGGQTYTVKNIAQADDYLDADGDRILSFAQAQEAALKMRVTPVKQQLGQYTCKQAIEAYAEYLEGRASGNDTRKRLEAFALPVFGDMAVADLKSDAIRKWHRDIAKTPPRQRASKGTVRHLDVDMNDPEIVRKRQVSANRCLTLFRAALNHARNEGKVDCSDSAWKLVKIFKGVDVPRTRFLSEAECKRLVNAAQGNFRVLVQAALFTGARYSELSHLRVADFNAEAGTLHVRISKSGKGRHITLCEDGWAFFKQLAAGRVGTDFLLGYKWRTGEQSRAMKEACKVAKIDGITFHGLRHTWASLARMGGMPLQVIAKNLGHVDTKMAEQHYGHLTADYVTEQTRKNAPKYDFGGQETNVKALR